MKFQTSLSLLFTVTSVFASQNTIIDAVNQISDSTIRLDKAAKVFTCDPKALFETSAFIHLSFHNGINQIKASASLSLTESLEIQSKVAHLQEVTESLVKTLESRKLDLDKYGFVAFIVSHLNLQLWASRDLADAIASKVPEEVRSFSEKLSGAVSTAVQKGNNNLQSRRGQGTSPFCGPEPRASIAI
jgi:hypothetical protein